MQKRKLDLAALRVDAFETARADVPIRGTVRAHDWSRLGEQTCGGISCDYACITYYDNTCRYVCAA